MATRLSTLLLVCCVSSGCAEFALFGLAKGQNFREATAEDPAVEVMCLWEPGEGRGPDSLPTRGFAGQLLFFTSRGAEPVKVEGDVRIYVFDDQGTEAEMANPIHLFNFDKVAWNGFCHETNLGPAYQLFVPYTRKGPHHAQCSLRVRFTPEGGGPAIYSKMATVVLPGERHEITAEKEAAISEALAGKPVTRTATQTLAVSPADMIRFQQSVAQLQRAAAGSVGADRQRHEEPGRLPHLDAQAIQTVGYETVEADDTPRSYRLNR
ncbi:MAG: hypothetical protein R3B90_16570 [Planctomycetaceae bacterium]